MSKLVPIERDREARESLCRALGLRQTPGSEYGSRPKLCRREAAITVWEIPIELDGLAKEVFGQLIVIRGSLPEMPQAALIGGPGIEAPGRPPHGALLFGVGDGRGNRDRHRLGDLVLYREDVGEIAVVM